MNSLLPIQSLVAKKWKLSEDDIELYGRYKGKLTNDAISTRQRTTQGKLILVTGMSPTPAGEGKTTTAIGLCDAMNQLGRQTVVCVREPSLGPYLGKKGGATGGGKSTIEPSEDINLHFTGDMHAISCAHNYLSSLIDNHLYHGNNKKLHVKSICWPRTIDLNDRSLRNMVIGLDGSSKSVVREESFVITPASEIMAVLCLATSENDLIQRLGKIIVGYDDRGQPIQVKHLDAHKMLATLLKNALRPNIVQTQENNLALVHGGPFANIAHGCNSVIATQSALSLSDYVVTEAGFGSDLGAEKFINIKCRIANLKPAVAVIVVTLRALYYHGSVNSTAYEKASCNTLAAGMENLYRHIHIVAHHFNLPCIVSINRHENDKDEDIFFVVQKLKKIHISVTVADHWNRGGRGALDLAELVVKASHDTHSAHRYSYSLQDSLFEKVRIITTCVYQSSEVIFSVKAKKKLASYEDLGFKSLPVCIAKTPYSFSCDVALRGAPENHKIIVDDANLYAGAGFVTIHCGKVITMPGLPSTTPAICQRIHRSVV